MITIRVADKKDFEILCFLRADLLKYHHFVNPSNKYDSSKIESSNQLIKTYLSRGKNVFYIAELNGAVIGFAHATLDAKPVGEIGGYLQDLFVLKHFRGQGVGTKLLDVCKKFFEDHGVNHGVTTDYVNKNKRVVDFYLRSGYVIDRVVEDVVYFKCCVITVE